MEWIGGYGLDVVLGQVEYSVGMKASYEVIGGWNGSDCMMSLGADWIRFNVGKDMRLR